MGAINIFLLGANSGIARSCLDLWAPSGARAYLVARNPEGLQETASRFKELGGEVVGTEVLDISEPAGCEAIIKRGFASLGVVDCFYLAAGVLPKNQEMEEAPEKVQSVLRTNFTVPAELLMRAANRLEEQGTGCLAALSSVAGDIGRGSNYVYGSSKAGLSALMEGMDARFAGTSIKVLDIRPGPVRTPMVAHLQWGLFFAKPEPVARRIVNAVNKGKRGRLYVPAYWRIIMSILRHLPSVIRRRADF
ncbi:MAG: SDR family NAD(P)-dependent oxidoreductase [Puniceicoccaceae bacterium]